MTAWLLVATIVASTCASDYLQTREMKRVDEVGRLGASAFGRVLAAIAARRVLRLGVYCMAVSFFAFLKLIQIADLSFAVPATALTYVINTAVAWGVLKEQVGGLRWAGTALVACGVVLLAL